MESQLVNILLIEADRVDVMNIQRLFRKSQILNPPFIANDAVSALTILRNEDPTTIMPERRRLILLASRLPGMGSTNFLQILRQDQNLEHIPVVILISALDEQERFERDGIAVASYMLKPVNFDQLAEVLQVINQFWTVCSMP